MTFELQDKEHEMKQWTNIRVFDCWDTVYQTHLFCAVSQHIQQCSWCAMMTWWLHLWIETLLLQLNYPRSWLLLLICCHPHQLQEKLQKYIKHSCLLSLWIIKDRCLQIYKKNCDDLKFWLQPPLVAILLLRISTVSLSLQQ